MSTNPFGQPDPDNFILGKEAITEAAEHFAPTPLDDLHVLGMIAQSIMDTLQVMQASGKPRDDADVTTAAGWTLAFTKGLLAGYEDYLVQRGGDSIPDSVPEGWL